MQSFIQRTTTFLTPNSSSTNLANSNSSAQSRNPSPAASSSSSTNNQFIFPPVSPQNEGPDCLHDCGTCAVSYPAKWSIDETDPLYGHIQGWATHLLIATGKSDWVRDVADEKGSAMEAIGALGFEKGELGNGRCMVSASDMLVPEDDADEVDGKEDGQTEVLVLPKWQIVEKVKPSLAREFMEGYVARVSTTESPIPDHPLPAASRTRAEDESQQSEVSEIRDANLLPQLASSPPPSLSISATSAHIPRPITTTFSTRPYPHSHLILLCSQKTRDARCGQSAPLLRREFERHLRPLGLYRDKHDQRPGGVAIHFISHVGGHRYAANVMIYRRGTEDGTEPTHHAEAAQCIWLARVRPEDCEAIIRYTVLQGKVVKPERQLRGGFDRARGLTSW